MCVCLVIFYASRRMRAYSRRPVGCSLYHVRVRVAVAAWLSAKYAKEVIAVDQDPLVRQGRRVPIRNSGSGSGGSLQVW